MICPRRAWFCIRQRRKCETLQWSVQLRPVPTAQAAPQEPCFLLFLLVPTIQAEQEERKRKLEQEASAASPNLAGGSADGVVEVGKDGAFDVDQTPMVRNTSADATTLASCDVQP